VREKVKKGFFTFSRTTNFSTAITLRTDLPLKMEQTECSETLAFKLQTPGNKPQEIIRHSKHGESLKSGNIYQPNFVKSLRIATELPL
jgi:hypothetical protein